MEREITIREYLDFDGLVMTDSGAFQGFTRPLYLKNSVIVRFQEAIGADIISPLDLVTPPGDSRTVAKRKLESTLKRLKEARSIVDKSILAAVQQGGKFPELRHQAVIEILEMGAEYIALGSLVPFFTKGHAIQFVIDVIHDARLLALSMYMGPAILWNFHSMYTVERTCSIPQHSYTMPAVDGI